MTDFMKKNKIQTSKTKKQLESVLKKSYPINRTINFLDMVFPVSMISNKDRYKDLIVSVESYLRSVDIVVKEVDNKICFCLDTKGIALRHPMGVDFTFYNSVDTSVYRYKNEDMILFLDSFGVDILDKDGRNDFLREVQNSGAVADFAKDIFYVIPTLSYKITLCDGEFPFMKDRTLLPILVYDTKSGEGWYIQSTGSKLGNESYRKGHTKILWGDDVPYSNYNNEGPKITNSFLELKIGSYSRRLR